MLHALSSQQRRLEGHHLLSPANLALLDLTEDFMCRNNDFKVQISQYLQGTILGFDSTLTFAK